MEFLHFTEALPTRRNPLNVSFINVRYRVSVGVRNTRRKFMNYDDTSWHYNRNFPQHFLNEAGATHKEIFLVRGLLADLVLSIKLVFSAILICSLLTISIYSQEPDTLWTKSYGGNLTDEGFDVQGTADGGFVAVGLTNSFGGVWLIKTDANGDTLWTKTYGTHIADAGNSVQQAGDKGFFITGFTSPTGFYEGRDYYLIRTDSFGDTLWTHHYGGNRRDEAFSGTPTSDGGYVLTGFTNQMGTQYVHSDMLSIKTDLDGDTLWTITYGEEFYDDGLSVHETDDNCYIIVGSTTTAVDTIMHAYLMKVSAVGDTIWTRKYGSQIRTRGFYGMQTADRGFILGGQINHDGWLVKTDSIGNVLWSKTWGGSTSSFINCVQQTNDNGYIFTMEINDGGSAVRDGRPGSRRHAVHHRRGDQHLPRPGLPNLWMKEKLS